MYVGHLTMYLVELTHFIFSSFQFSVSKILTEVQTKKIWKICFGNLLLYTLSMTFFVLLLCYYIITSFKQLS